jgi:hypothetical protein
VAELWHPTGLFSQVLRLLAAEGMVSLGLLSVDGTKLAGNASPKANKTLPQIGKLLAEAAGVDAAEDAQYGSAAGPVTPRLLAQRADRQERLAAARDRLAAEDAARRDAQRAKQQAWDAAAAEGRPRAPRRPADEPRTNRNNTEPRANLTDPDVRVMRNQKGYVAGYNGQLVVTAQQVIAGAVLSQHRPAAPCCTRCPRPAASSWPAPGSAPSCALSSPAPGMSARRTSPAPAAMACGCSRPWPKTLPGAASAPPSGPATWTGFRPPPAPPGACTILAGETTTRCGPAPWNQYSGN